MTYICVKWLHNHHDEPVLLYSELDDDRWEIRKVEVFRDGYFGFAGRDESDGITKLGEEPIPGLSEIAADPQFQPSEIGAAAFEQAWEMRGRTNKEWCS